MPNALSCSSWKLYVIIDRAAAKGRDLAELARQAIKGGADVIQLRDKAAPLDALIQEGKRLARVAEAAGVPLIINDSVDAAMACGADGVHLGQDDMPVAEARRLLRPGMIVGKSTHNLQQALTADQEAIDYLAVGPIYSTPTKPDYPFVGLDLIREVADQLVHPMVSIGGIDADKLPEVLAAGARCVAVVRAVCAAENPELVARQLKHLLV